MNAAAWIALATLAFLFVVQFGAGLFVLGGLFQRVKALEARKDGSDCAAELAALNATLSALKESVDQRFHSLEQTVQQRFARQTRGRIEA